MPFQFKDSLEKTRLARKEAQRLAEKEAKMLERQKFTPPNSQPTPQEKEEELRIEQQKKDERLRRLVQRRKNAGGDG